MNPHVAQKLFSEITIAEVAFRMRNIDPAETLRRRANFHRGHTRRELLRIADLGEGIHVFMDVFLDEMQDKL
jgi:hypothetical protein